jgi:hypothetical protein
MVLGAQPWAAIELLGPSSYHLLEDIFNMSEREPRVQFKKSMDVMMQ